MTATSEVLVEPALLAFGRVYVGQEQQLAAVVRKHVCTPSAGSTSTSEVAVIVLGEQVQAWVNASENQKSLVFIGAIAWSNR